MPPLDRFTSLVQGFLEHLLADVRDSVSGLVETYMSTHDVASTGACSLP